MDRAQVRALVVQLNRDAERIAGRFGLRYRSIEAERANVTNRYGVCYADGVIKIRLRHAVSGRSLKYSSLVNTLCHELAHLRHFHHGPRFQSFYLKLLEFARVEGIYRPGSASRPVPAAARPRAAVVAAGPPSSRTRPRPESPAGPVQLALF